MSPSSRWGWALLLALGCGRGRSTTPPPPIPSPLPTIPEPSPVDSAPSDRPTCASLFDDVAPAPGPVYALVRHVGLVEIGDTTSRVLIGSTEDSWSSTMAIDAAGRLWLGGFADADLLILTTPPTTLSPFGDEHPLIHTLAPRGPDDVWLVTDDIEWAVARYDGARWHTERTRADFRREDGYSDNKLTGMARVGDTIYVGCWNGLWRRDAEGWAEIPPPDDLEPPATPLRVHATAQGALVSFSRATYLHNDDGWHARRVAPGVHYVSPDGLAVAVSRFGSELSLALYSSGEVPCTTSLPTLPSRHLDDVTLDRRGRAWVATDAGLSVVTPDGELAAHWNFGELVGLDARIRRLIAVAGGPATLPPPTQINAWTLEGRLHFAKGSAPVSGRRVLLCPSSFIDRDCKGAPFVRSSITEADGSFRFVGVPPGDLGFVVVHPPQTPECDSPFVARPHFVSPMLDCPRADRVCDLGDRSECPAFEMPPPIH